jgi:hypothetical protein
MNEGVEEGLQPPRMPRRLGSFSKTDVLVSDTKQRPESRITQFLRRASSTFGNPFKKT